jgi:hypothetical protein
MPSKPGLRIVKLVQTGQPREYTSLRQACADAASNDTIELQFNGRLVEERPFRLSNKEQLTIRAGTGYSPTIVFRPREPVTSGPQAMLTVVGGQLTLDRVNLEVEIPPRLDPPSWALFQTQRARSLQLHQCWLTIRNATAQRTSQHPFVAFFDIKAPPDTGAMAMDGAMAEHSVNIDLRNCVVRGEATLLRCEDLQPVRFDWDNGLLATSERLLVAQGGEMANRPNGQISIDLRHITAHVRNGLCLIDKKDGSSPLLFTSLHCSDSILLGNGDAPLVEHSGTDSVDDFQSKFEWVGSHYFYTGFSTFWKISSFASALPAQDPVQRSFEEWQKHWGEGQGNPHRWSQVVWKQLPDSSRPFHTYTSADYVLDETSAENEALQGAADRSDAGFQAENLPPDPDTRVNPPPAPATASTPEEEQ